MVDGLALCSCACVTCLWCSLLALCFPKFFKKLQECESSDCCNVGSATREKFSRVIDGCKSTANSKPDHKIQSTLHKPKCTVRIIRKTRMQSPRQRESDEGFCTANVYSKKLNNYNFKEPIDSGVQTDSHQLRRKQRYQINTKDCSCNDDPEENKRYKIHARLSHRPNCSDESLNVNEERGRLDDVWGTEDGFNNRKKSPRYNTQIFHDCDDQHR